MLESKANENVIKIALPRKLKRKTASSKKMPVYETSVFKEQLKNVARPRFVLEA